MVICESSQWLGKEYCVEYWLKELQESMERCTGRCDIHVTVILLKTALNTIQSKADALKSDQSGVLSFAKWLTESGTVTVIGTSLLVIVM